METYFSLNKTTHPQGTYDLWSLIVHWSQQHSGLPRYKWRYFKLYWSRDILHIVHSCFYYCGREYLENSFLWWGGVHCWNFNWSGV